MGPKGTGWGCVQTAPIIFLTGSLWSTSGGMAPYFAARGNSGPGRPETECDTLPLSLVEKPMSKSSWQKAWEQQDHPVVTKCPMPGPGVQKLEGRRVHPVLKSADPAPHTSGL